MMMNMSSSSSSSGKASEFEAVESLKLKHQDDVGGGVQVTNFTELVDDVTLHFQIIRLPKQVWYSYLFTTNEFGKFLHKSIYLTDIRMDRL